TRAGLPLPALDQEGEVEEDALPRRSGRRWTAPRVVRAPRQLVEQLRRPLAAASQHLAHQVLLLLLAQEERSAGRAARLRLGRFGREPQRARLVEQDAQAPFLAPGEPIEEAIDALAVAGHVLERPLIAVEEGEQLHREHCPGTADELDHRLVRQGTGRDPGEVAQSFLDRLLGIAIGGRIGGDQPDALARLEGAQLAGAGEAPRSARERPRLLAL